ncbi:hypothetical protein ElyMa_005341400 [Elysia marginata]|uniref:Uncharacterized protein n=1 Tax=Elysia marginata TaxID=1093978 RepID=A0AAV4EB01_9GAST|nr:hypothetical protein ElyMa_005341400 [Elysia marginata]
MPESWAITRCSSVSSEGSLVDGSPHKYEFSTISVVAALVASVAPATIVVVLYLMMAHKSAMEEKRASQVSATFSSRDRTTSGSLTSRERETLTYTYTDVSSLPEKNMPVILPIENMYNQSVSTLVSLVERTSMLSESAI